MNVETNTSAPRDWNEYVDNHPDSTAYHRVNAVNIGAKAFGLKTYFITSRSGCGQMDGVLPLVEQSSFAFGRYLVSLPFFTYGGMLSDSNDISVALAEEARRLALDRRADHLELRHSVPITELMFSERLDKVSMLLGLPATEEELSRQFGSKLRSQIRRAERERPSVIWGGAELLPEFYSVFAPCMHSLGTPVYSRRFFDVVYEATNNQMSLVVVRAHGKTQAAAAILQHGAHIEVPWAAASNDAKRTAMNMRMYWEILKLAIERGAETFDFGRSTVDSGTYRFKAQWGAKPRQLHWHYWMRKSASIPQLNHANPRYALAASAWRRMPLWCANLIGPHIARNLP